MNHRGLTTSLTALHVQFQSHTADTAMPMTIQTPRSANVGTASRLSRERRLASRSIVRGRAFSHERRWPYPPDIEEQRHHLERPGQNPQAGREAERIAGMRPVVIPHDDREHPVPCDDDEQAERTNEIDVLVPTPHRCPRSGRRDAARRQHSLQSGDARGTLRPHEPDDRRGRDVHRQAPRHTVRHGNDELGEGSTLGLRRHAWSASQHLPRRPVDTGARRAVQRPPRRRRGRPAVLRGVHPHPPGNGPARGDRLPRCASGDLRASTCRRSVGGDLLGPVRPVARAAVVESRRRQPALRGPARHRAGRQARWSGDRRHRDVPPRAVDVLPALPVGQHPRPDHRPRRQQHRWVRLRLPLRWGGSPPRSAPDDVHRAPATQTTWRSPPAQARLPSRRSVPRRCGLASAPPLARGWSESGAEPET